jgi:hypothetical protein
MYVLLHGAKKNAGDYLIFERARELIRAYRKTEDFLILPRWLPLDEHLDTINRSQGIIICGGPGYAHHFYPGIYPLVNDLSYIKVPIIPLAVGWTGRPSDPDDFRFTPESIAAIREIHSRIRQSSTRDVLTERIVKKVGVDNVAMTGCAAWYYLPLVERDFMPPATVKRVVVTTPARLENFRQAFQVVDAVRRWFPKAELYLVFHRGMLPDRHTKPHDAASNLGLAAYGRLRGYRVINAAFSTDQLAFYRDCDLHIGYRVHGHLDFLSYRRPSILIQEDGRGLGQTLTLGTQDVAADDSEALSRLEAIVEHYKQTNFVDFEAVVGKMKVTHSTMRGFIESF